MIIFRYLAKEITTTLCAVTGVLLFIFLSNQVIRYLNYAATGKIAASVLVHLILLQIPYLLGLLLPMGIFFGVLLALARMYVDNEMTVFFASGLSQMRLLRVILSLALVLAIFAGVLTLWVNPIIAGEKDILASGGGNTGSAILNTIIPGRFQASGDGSAIFYAQKMSNHKQKIKNFFMAERPKSSNDNSASSQQAGRGWSVVSAKSAFQEVKHNGDRFIVATNGHRYQGVPGADDFLMVKFGQYGVRLTGLPISAPVDDEQAKSTLLLLLTSTRNLDDMAELQWRISIPIAVILLALLAVPLSRVNPRQGKYAQFLPAVLICIVYINMLFVARGWIRVGKLSPWLGIWWVHGALLLIALVWMWLQSRGRA